MKKKHTKLTTTRIIMAGFVLGIIVGMLLLMLPISHRGVLSVDDALFMSTTSICVTGLATVNVGNTFTLFGQIIMLILIEVGGLGVITFTALIMLILGKHLNLSDRLLIQSAYNVESMTGLVKMTKRIFKASLIIETIGALLYMPVFIRDYGLIGIWYSIFHSVSAYCNAGIDILGGNSFVAYQTNVLINLNTMFLIIAGGLGFPVYWEIAYLFSSRKDTYRKKMSVGSKIAIIATVVLIFLGAALTLVFEWNNPLTIGNLSIGDKIMSSVFQSVTLRTAGFATIDQAGFEPASCLWYLFMMLIGGSPAGTAGGIKTVGVVILFASMIANIKGSSNVNILKRRIDNEYVRSCSAIATFSLAALLILTMLLMFVQQGNFLNILYEMTSAIATVGLSRGATAELGVIGKMIVVLTMYLGRIGPITLALSFNYKNVTHFSYASDSVTL